MEQLVNDRTWGANKARGNKSITQLCIRRDMDRQHIQDREKWKSETAQKIKDTKVCASCDGNRLGGQRKEWHLQGCLDTSGSSQVLRWKWKYPENLFPTAILRFK